MADIQEVIKKSLELVFSPMGILTAAAILGILTALTRKHRQLGCRLLLCSSLLLIVFLFTPLAEYLILGLERPYQPLLKPPDPSDKVDGIVILAGYGEDHAGFPPTSTLSHHTICNLTEGLRLYRLIPGARIILSGGTLRAGDRPVSSLMADFLEQMGVPAEKLVVENRSRNTYENLVAVKEIVGSRPFILVTAACDLKRALGVAQKLQMNAIPAPACFWARQHHPEEIGLGEKIAVSLQRFGAASENLPRLQWAYHEYLGYLWYRLLGRI